jgi:PAS domain S-box-containing protein
LKDQEFLKELNILFVDDDADIRKKFKITMENIFKNLYLACDGQEAIEIYQNKKVGINVIISEIDMPNFNGIKLLEEIRKEDKFLPFFFSSTHTEPEFLLKVIKLKVNDYILKPIDSLEIIDKIYSACSFIRQPYIIEKQKKELERYLKVIDNVAIISKSDLDGNITFANKIFCDISGYSKEELIGKPHSMVRHDDMTKQSFEKLWQDLKENKYWHGEIKNKNKDGGFYWVDSIIEADYDLQDNHIGYHSVIQNITDKKEIEILKENLENINIDLEDQVHEKILEVMHLNKEIRDSQKEIIFTMGIIGESRSKETANHVKRVAEYSKLLAKYSGLDDYKAELLKQASPMHDIGKVGISDAILNKPGRLTQQEMKIMMTHTELGYAMLKHSDKELLKLSASIAYEHHEKYDGSGYPRGLKGEEICIEGRITAVADVFDALGSNRVYKKSWRDEDIFSMFIKEKGKHFDPKIIDIFLEHKQDFIDIRNKFLD